MNVIDLRVKGMDYAYERKKRHENKVLEDLKYYCEDIQHNLKMHRDPNIIFPSSESSINGMCKISNNYKFYNSYYENEYYITKIIKLLKIQIPNTIILCIGSGECFEQIIPKFVFDIIKKEIVSIIWLETFVSTENDPNDSFIVYNNDKLNITSRFIEYIDKMFKITESEAYRNNLHINLLKTNFNCLFHRNEDVIDYSFLMTLLYDITLNGINEFSFIFMDSLNNKLSSQMNLINIFKKLEQCMQSKKITLFGSLDEYKNEKYYNFEIKHILFINLFKNNVNLVALNKMDKRYIYMPKILNEERVTFENKQYHCDEISNDRSANSLSYDELISGSFIKQKNIMSGGNYHNKYKKYKYKYLNK